MAFGMLPSSANPRVIDRSGYSWLMALTDDSRSSPFVPLLGDKRTRYAHTEFCRS